MRVLLIAPDIQDYCVAYANALAGHADVTMVAPVRLFSRHEPYVNRAVDLRLLNWPRHRSVANILFVPRLIRTVEMLLPSVVHVLSEGVVWLNLALPTFRKYGVVTTMHDVIYHPGDKASQRLSRFVDFLVARSDRIIVHGESLKIEAKRRYPNLAERFEVLPHIQLRRYHDIALRARMERSSDTIIRVLFFGRIFAYKGLDFLIRSIPKVAARFANIRVVIAGEGGSMSGYEKLILDPKFFDIRNRDISDEETAQLFVDADIVVLPYIEASQSGVLAIANAFAKPLIVTDVGELGQSVENEQTGLVVPPRDENALSDAIIRLISDVPLRDRLGVAGRNAAERLASPELVATRAMEIYEKTARGPR